MINKSRITSNQAKTGGAASNSTTRKQARKQETLTSGLDPPDQNLGLFTLSGSEILIKNLKSGAIIPNAEND